MDYTSGCHHAGDSQSPMLSTQGQWSADLLTVAVVAHFPSFLFFFFSFPWIQVRFPGQTVFACLWKRATFSLGLKPCESAAEGFFFWTLKTNVKKASLFCQLTPW